MRIKVERTMHFLSKKGFCCFILQCIALLKQVFLELDPHRPHLDILANASGSVSPFCHWSVWLPLGWDLAPGQCIFNRVLHSHPACCHCLGGLHNYRPKADPQKHPEHILRKRHGHHHTLLGVHWLHITHAAFTKMLHDFKRSAMFLSSSLANKSYFYWEFLQREAPFFLVSLWGGQRSNSQSLQCFQNCLLCSLLLKDTMMHGSLRWDHMVDRQFLKAAWPPKTIHLSLVLFVVKSALI